jgi:hypothetical protein
MITRRRRSLSPLQEKLVIGLFLLAGGFLQCLVLAVAS